MREVIHYRYRILAGLALAVGVSCRDASPTGPGRSFLSTDATRYTATSIGSGQVTLTVVTRYENSADTAVILNRCTPTAPYPIYFVELISPADGEGAAYNPGWACVGHNQQLVVPAGAVRTDTLTLRGPNSYDSRTQRFLGVLAGTFRLSYGGQESNTFTVQLSAGGVAP
jgi:hypothetical protein